MKDNLEKTTKKIIQTAMMHRYMFKLCIRLTIFLLFLSVYITNKDYLITFLTHEFTFGLVERGPSLLHVLWAVFMVMMIRHILPQKRFTMALRKRLEEPYSEVPGYSELSLMRFVQKSNIRAWTVLLIWLFFNAIFGALYVFNKVDNADLLMLTVFYFLCDYICILFFCPFQSYIMKNKCCVNCRIFDWGHFMMFTPMLFIRNFFSWSLFFTSLIVMIHWEILYAKYPERFWFGSNRTLQCASCKDRTCQLKARTRQPLLRE